ncbi:O-methyltransferase [Longispora fulva]|uniref:SAM-dependent methyltransferase n=1 Tax=Longispora fulva TaxID=619741 RepID=A0A8J7KUN3_9ACTN|nr:methyltransferase [Longispora fulva]MBG6134222.1 SAM-dependent methyltransferase [Longispora fulva]GIG63114.1 O-methyltransferase [Longispora fulva]
MTTTAPSSDTVAAAQRIVSINNAYFRSKALHSAVELGLFALLADAPRTVAEICEQLKLSAPLATDFLDALVGLELLDRDGGRYANSADADALLVPGRPGYLGGSVLQHSTLHYHSWARLTDALRSGDAQSGTTVTGRHGFAKHYEDPDRARRLMDHMDSFTTFVAPQIAATLDWGPYRTFVDLGGARGNLAARLVQAQPHLRGTVFDLPALRELFDEHMAGLETADSVSFHPGDFFSDPLPSADVVIIGHILHDWPVAARMELVRRAYEALPAGGVLAVYDAMLDDSRAEPGTLLQSLNCGMIRDGGGEYTVTEAGRYAEAAGFTVRQVTPLRTITRDRVLVAVKPG